jgi:hypothetical protein
VFSTPLVARLIHALKRFTMSSNVLIGSRSSLIRFGFLNRTAFAQAAASCFCFHAVHCCARSADVDAEVLIF